MKTIKTLPFPPVNTPPTQITLEEDTRLWDDLVIPRPRPNDIIVFPKGTVVTIETNLHFATVKVKGRVYRY